MTINPLEFTCILNARDPLPTELTRFTNVVDSGRGGVFSYFSHLLWAILGLVYAGMYAIFRDHVTYPDPKWKLLKLQNKSYISYFRCQAGNWPREFFICFTIYLYRKSYNVVRHPCSSAGLPHSAAAHLLQTSSFTTSFSSPFSQASSWILTKRMDPLTCLSVAGTVIQFVDFASKLISKGHELYKAGELSVHEKVALATNDLLDLNIKLQQPLYSDVAHHRVTKDEANLQDLCNASSELAKELLERLGQLKITDKHNVARSLRKAFRSVWERKELNELEDRLERLRSAIHTRILASLRYHIPAPMYS